MPDSKPARPVGISNRPVAVEQRLAALPLRWQNVDAGVVRSFGPNTGYRYPGSTFDNGFGEALYEQGQPLEVKARRHGARE